MVGYIRMHHYAPLHTTHGSGSAAAQSRQPSMDYGLWTTFNAPTRITTHRWRPARRWATTGTASSLVRSGVVRLVHERVERRVLADEFDAARLGVEDGAVHLQPVAHRGAHDWRAEELLDRVEDVELDGEALHL